jgi:hypothetical protein
MVEASHGSEVLIRHSPTKLILLALGSLAFSVGGFFVAWEESLSGGTHILGWLLAILTIAFFGYCLYFAVDRLVRNPVALIINEHGFEDRSSSIGCGFLPWSEIDFAFVTTMQGQRFVSLVPKDVKSFLDSQPKSRAKLMQANIVLCGAPINFSCNSLAIRLPQLMSLVSQYVPVREHR